MLNIGANSILLSSEESKLQAGPDSPLPPPQMVRSAVRIYLHIAYPSGVFPPAVKRILEKLDAPNADFYGSPVFVHEPDRSAQYLRLGNCNFPHMKLYIETLAGGSRCVFRADTHDRHIAVTKDHPEFESISNLCRSNQKIAEAIEEAWERAGLPTFKACLADEVARRARQCE